MATARRVRRGAAAEQDQIKLNGHAIEARVYAENPQKNFMPVGRIKTWRTPPEGDGLRIVPAIAAAITSAYYDAMLAR